MTVRILVGDVRERLVFQDKPAILRYNECMVKNDGRFKKGERRSQATEFKPGHHWRNSQPFREKSWLEAEYVVNHRSSGDIAKQFGVTDAAVLFWLRKHGIPRRSISGARAVKHWGAEGESNPMHGKRGPQAPNWKGGFTPERQAFYSSAEWKRAARFVRSRDKGICRRCGTNAKGAAALHHVIPFAVVAYRADPDNLVTLCKTCHVFVHSRENVNAEFIGKEV